MEGRKEEDVYAAVSAPSLNSSSILLAITQSYGDNATLQITQHKLNGKNFLQWSQSVQMVILGRGKMGYINGEIKKPSHDSPEYAA